MFKENSAQEHTCDLFSSNDFLPFRNSTNGKSYCTKETSTDYNNRSTKEHEEKAFETQHDELVNSRTNKTRKPELPVPLPIYSFPARMFFSHLLPIPPNFPDDASFVNGNDRIVKNFQLAETRRMDKFACVETWPGMRRWHIYR